VDRVIELSPDVVLMNEEENRREDAETLRAAGIRVHASMPRNAAETATMVRSIGAVIGRPQVAEVIAGEIESRASRVSASARRKGAVRYAYLIWRTPWMTVNDDTFVAGLLSLPSGVNVFGTHAERYPEITIPDLIAGSPDVVFLASEPFPFAEKHIEELATLLDWSRKRFALVDGELLSWHGSRTTRGIAYAEEVVEAVRVRSAAAGRRGS
jgi:ABC-type Fe3+-hydroxamate transport system substrate-binding protein